MKWFKTSNTTFYFQFLLLVTPWQLKKGTTKRENDIKSPKKAISSFHHTPKRGIYVCIFQNHSSTSYLSFITKSLFSRTFPHVLNFYKKVRYLLSIFSTSSYSLLYTTYFLSRDIYQSEVRLKSNRSDDVVFSPSYLSRFSHFRYGLKISLFSIFTNYTYIYFLPYIQYIIQLLLLCSYYKSLKRVRGGEQKWRRQIIRR